MICPLGVMRPISVPSVNHRLPSGPAVIASELLPFGSGNSVICPLGVMRPISVPSVNHRLPSGPAVIASVDPLAGNSVICQARPRQNWEVPMSRLTPPALERRPSGDAPTQFASEQSRSLIYARYSWNRMPNLKSHFATCPSTT